MYKRQAYGYPKEEAARIALKTAFDWMQINPKYGMRILFACFDQETTARYQSTWNGSQEDVYKRQLHIVSEGSL